MSTAPDPIRIAVLASGRTQVRVRYEETDRAGVGYHANTFVWFECARTEMMRELGVPYRDLEEKGWLLTVTEAEARYDRPVFYDDLLTVESSITEAKGARLRIEYEIRAEDGILRTTGHTVLACLDATTGRPRRLPPALLSVLGQGNIGSEGASDGH